MILNNDLVLAVYDGDSFQLSCYIERPIFIEYLPSYDSGGTFKIVAQVTDQNTQCIKKNSLIHIESNVVGVVSYIKLSSELTMTIEGSLGDSLLSQRWLFELLSVTNSSPGQIIQSVYNELTTIPYLSFVDYSSYTGDPIDMDIEPVNFLEFLQEICQKYELGYRIVVNTTNPLTLNFEIYQGTDKSNTVIMSQNYESIADFDYTLSSQSLVNYVKVIGQNNIEVAVTSDPAPTGVNLCEYYLDCTGIDQGSMTEAEYRKVLSDKGQEIIDKHKVKETYSGNYTNLTFIYGTDYSLGDIITAQDSRFDINTPQRVIEAIKQFDSSGIYLQLKFGEVQNNISSVTKDLVKRVEKMENRENLPSGGSSGVGEDIGNNSERFNDYMGNTATGNHSYLHIEGKDNTATWGYATHIEGWQNTAAGCNTCYIGGAMNSVTGGQFSVVHGQHNQLNSGSYNAIFGEYNSCNGYNYNIIGGGGGHSYDGNTVTGNGNIVGGERNTVSGYYNTVGGYYNNVSSYYSMVSGHSNETTGEYNLTVGNGNKNAAAGSIMCGENGNATYNDKIIVGNGSNSSNRSNCFRVDYQGNVYASVYNTSGADYAEFFEWADGNPSGEDRRGLIVEYLGDCKIVPANSNTILGIVSSCPSVVGNAFEEYWHGKFKKDIFGSYILDEEGHMQLSEEFDPNQVYVPRSKRKEWAPIGLIGKLIVVDDGTCKPNSYAIAKNGIATASKDHHISKIRVLERIDNSHIKVLIQ